MGSLQAYKPDVEVHAYFAPATPPASTQPNRSGICRCCAILWPCLLFFLNPFCYSFCSTNRSFRSFKYLHTTSFCVEPSILHPGSLLISIRHLFTYTFWSRCSSIAFFDNACRSIQNVYLGVDIIFMTNLFWK